MEYLTRDEDGNLREADCTDEAERAAAMELASRIQDYLRRTGFYEGRR